MELRRDRKILTAAATRFETFQSAGAKGLQNFKFLSSWFKFGERIVESGQSGLLSYSEACEELYRYHTESY
jgi:hypothetical protein